MNEVVVQALYFMGSYLGIIFVFFFGMNFLTKGFFLSYIKVKASRGKKILIRCRSLADIYFAVGKNHGDYIRYKNRIGDYEMLTPKEKGVFHYMGVLCIDFDEKSKEIIQENNVRTPAVDTQTADALFQRAIQLGKLIQKTREQIIMILLVVLVVGVAISLYQNYMLSDAISSINQLTGVIQ